MLKLRKVALTGGLSCGKSSVCRFLKELGAYTISADEIVHQLLFSDINLIQKVIALLGPSIVVNQKIDRSRMARLVFQDEEKLQALEQLIHPLVYQTIDQEYLNQQKMSVLPPLFVAEIPLLFESGGKRDYDRTIAVIANPEICLQRFKQATGGTIKDFNQRMAQQGPLLDKANGADYVLLNNRTLSHLQQITRELYQELIES